MRPLGNSLLPFRSPVSLGRSLLALIAMLFIGATGSARAQPAGAATKMPQVTVALSAESVELGDSLIYQLTVDGVSSADPPTGMNAGSAKVDFLGGHDESSRSIMTINGRTTETSVLRYIMQWRVTPDRKGPGAVEGFSLDVAGQKINVPRAEFNVVEARPNPNFTLMLEADTTSAYVGEPIRMRLVWLLGNNVRSASFSGPDGDTDFDVAALDPRSPQVRGRPLQQGEPYNAVPFLNGEAIITRSQIEQGGRVVPRFIMDLVVTPRRAGKLEIGPYRVAMDEIVGQRTRSLFDAFMDDRTKRSVVTSNTLTLDVKLLPTDGRPADFGGLVGVFSIESKAGNTEANVGDPIPLTITISGPEPLEAVKPPNLELQTDFATEFKPSPEGWETPTSVPAVTGERMFATTIRPKSAGITEIPAIRLPYFDTKSGKYAVATSKPIPLKVRAAREFTAADVQRPGGAAAFSLPTAAASTLTSTGAGVGANSESLDALRDQRTGLLASASTPTGVALIGLPPITLLFVCIGVWRSRSIDPQKHRRSAALRKANRAVNAARTPQEVLRSIQIGLAPFVGARPEAVAASDPGGAPIPAPIAERAARLMSTLEGASFDNRQVNIESIRAEAKELFSTLNR